MIKYKISLFIVLAAAIYSCQRPVIKNFIPQPDKPITTANQNFSRTGMQEFIIQDSLKIMYNDDLKGLPFSSYLQYSGELIFTTHNGYLYFVSLDDFNNIRKAHIADGIMTTPSIQGETLFIAVNKGDEGLIAYNLRSGKINWDISGKLSQSSPVLTKRHVIHATLDGQIFAYNKLDGSRSWQVEYDDPVVNNLAMMGNDLIIASQNGKISNYDPETGSLKWSLKIAESVYASPIISSQFVYISTYSGSILQITIDNGEINNRYNANVELYKTPSLDSKTLYIPLANGNLIALDKTNLKIKWQQKLDSPFSSSILLGSMEIISGTESKMIYRLNKFTGEITQTLKLDGRLRTQPIYYMNKIYLSYEPDFLTVLSTKEESDD